MEESPNRGLLLPDNGDGNLSRRKESEKEGDSWGQSSVFSPSGGRTFWPRLLPEKTPGQWRQPVGAPSGVSTLSKWQHFSSELGWG